MRSRRHVIRNDVPAGTTVASRWAKPFARCRGEGAVAAVGCLDPLQVKDDLRHRSARGRALTEWRALGRALWEAKFFNLCNEDVIVTEGGLKTP